MNSTSMPIPLTVVIATHGRSHLLSRTLNSLAGCDRPLGYQGIIVVENGGRGEAEKIVAASSDVLKASYRFVPVANKSVALNAAIKTIDGLVVFLDDDVRASPSLLTAYQRAATERREKAYFGGPLNIDYEIAPPEWLRKYLPNSVTGWNPSPDAHSDQLRFLGANWAAFSHEMHAAGGFDERLGPNVRQSVGEDTSMQLALRRNGSEPILVQAAEVWHYVPSESCTPRWALRRAFRHAMYAGNESRDTSVRLGGVPRWMYIEMLRRGAQALFASIFRSDPSVRHEALHRFFTFRGWMAGIRTSSQRPTGTSRIS